MAANPIKYSDLVVDDGAIKLAIQHIDEFERSYKKAYSSIMQEAEKAKKTMGGLSPANPEDQKRIDDLEKSVKQYKDTLDKLNQTNERVQKTKKAVNELTFAERKAKIQSTEATKRQNAALRALVQEEKAQEGSIKALILETNRLNKSRQSLDLRSKEGQKEYARLTVRIKDNTDKLKEFDKEIGRSQRFVGEYEKALGSANNVLRSFGIGLGIAGGVSVLRNALGVVKDFDQAVADLGAISGKTADEIKPLVEQAKLLGSTTQFTATQAAEAQIELAKLGFTVPQIQDSTGAILNFAAATGAELADAAALGGSALRAFGLEADQMDRVVSTLGVATTKTALDFRALETGLSTVAPVAAAFGFSIEDTTALLGQLANSGFDASSSATATRNILLSLADANGDLAKSLGRPIKSTDDLAAGLQELQAKGVDLAQALELTDKRSVAAFQTFLNGADTLTDLRDSITDVNGELQDMADKRLDSISGQMALLTSAWEGWILAMNEGTGAGNAFKNVLGFLAKNLDTILSTTVKLGSVFVVYKATMMSANVLTKAYNASQFLLSGTKAILTGNTIKATVATNNFSKAIKANPLGFYLSIIAGVVTALIAFSDWTTKSEKAQLALNDAVKEGSELGSKSAKSFRNMGAQMESELNRQIEIRRNNGEDEKKLEAELLAGREEIQKKKIEAINAEIERIQELEKTTRRNSKMLVFEMENELKETSKLNSGKRALLEERLFLLNTEIRANGKKTQEYVKALQSEIVETIKTNEVIISEQKKHGKELTKEQIAEAKKRQQELDILRRRAEDLEDQRIEDEFKRQEQKLWRSFEREMEAIKGQSAIEIRLRKELRIKLDNDLLELEKQRHEKSLKLVEDAINEQNKLQEDAEKEKQRIKDANLNQEISNEERLRKEKRTINLISVEDEEEFNKLEIEQEIDTLERKLAIYKDYGQSTIDIELEIAEKKRELRRKEIEEEKKKEDEIRKYRDMAVNAAFDRWAKNTEKQKQEAEKQIQNTENQIQKQQQLAQEGLENSLAFEEAAKAEQELKLQELQKKQERIEKIKGLYASYANYSQQGDKDAVGKALRDFAILEGITASFGDGGIVEDAISNDGKKSSLRGRLHKGMFSGEKHSQRGQGILAWVEGDEGILSRKNMRNLGKDNFYKLKETLDKGPIGSDLFHGEKHAFIHNLAPQVVIDNQEVVGEIKKLREDMKSVERLTDFKIENELEKYVTIISERTSNNTKRRKKTRVKIT